jgi:hypothetical protein
MSVKANPRRRAERYRLTYTARTASRQYSTALKQSRRGRCRVRGSTRTRRRDNEGQWPRSLVVTPSKCEGIVLNECRGVVQSGRRDVALAFFGPAETPGLGYKEKLDALAQAAQQLQDWIVAIDSLYRGLDTNGQCRPERCERPETVETGPMPSRKALHLNLNSPLQSMLVISSAIPTSRPKHVNQTTPRVRSNAVSNVRHWPKYRSDIYLMIAICDR